MSADSASTTACRKLVGVCPPARGAAVAAEMRERPAPVWLLVTEDARAAEALAEDVAFFHDAADTKPAPVAVAFPESAADSRDQREAFAHSAARLGALGQLRARRAATVADPGPALFIVTTPQALLQPVPAPEAAAKAELTLTAGQRVPFQGLLEKLRALDYDAEAVCEAPGQYAVRGGIIDLFPITASQPVRLDFFGDDLEEIRQFDPVSQRSGAAVAAVTLEASPRVKLDQAVAGLADYLPAATHLILIEPAALEGEWRNAMPDGADARWQALLDNCAQVTGIAELDEAATTFDAREPAIVEWKTARLAEYRRHPKPSLVAQERLHAETEARREFLHRLAAWQEDGYGIALVTAKEGEERRAREILAEDRSGSLLRPRHLRGTLNEGFILTSAESGAEFARALADPKPGDGSARRRPGWRGVVVVTETEAFGRQRARQAAAGAPLGTARAQVDQLLDLAELAEGDHVVHLQHGIAIFRGMVQLETRDGRREVISLEFDERVTLHVPLTEAHLVSRYVGLGKARPKLGRIGSGRWEKTRQAAERATLDLAADLLRIHAAREAQPREALPPDNDWQREFESSFPFAETPDQHRAILETKADLERTRPMDRLICGDVGYGKTEVAIRAAFKTVQGGRQVAILAPTTVLAQQHLNTLRERMAGYPVAIELLSRFRTQAEQAAILAATAAGQVDILVGTHRLLQADLKFRSLGLVVIDEEQRFGVRHKERFKALRAGVDVLSMSATPIPRTLYLALTGARDLSVIDSPPANRLPIQTIVKTYDEQTVVDAIRQEIRRGGQVFYLHNRVDTIGGVAARLRELLPTVGIATGHGQMEGNALEGIMTDFVAGKFQVLVCTTIIESGLDLPNCNTIIIEGADRFGLAQLHQLRGRVGRFKHQAYAYLLLHRHTQLVESARQRLTAMRTHNQPGAGFRIAMRDLELRGSGNLLGAQQSGHIAGVGFDLYCQLLRQSVARLKGDRRGAAIRPSVKLDFVTVGEGGSGPGGEGRHQDAYTAVRDAENLAGEAEPIERIEARIPVSYIGEPRLRIDFHRKLALAQTKAQLQELEAAMRDRFGRFKDEVKALLLLSEIRLWAEQKGLSSIETEGSRLKCRRASGRPDDWVQAGTRFPRLTAPKPLLRLREIIHFLQHLPDPAA